MSTAHKTEAEIQEHFDAPDVLQAKVKALADLVRQSNNMVTWTGAGISTSTGVPDFRGPNGLWTMKAQNRKPDPSLPRVTTLTALPSPTHLAMVKLVEVGRLKGLISSNTDGLHRRSGIDCRKIAELHGNSNKARCNGCGRYGLVDARVRIATLSKQHGTGIRCIDYPKCRGEMEDTIINFGEYLYSDVAAAANGFGRKADLLLCLGSSLRVITCNALEDIQKRRGGKLVVVNLQTTPYDDVCDLRIFARTDDVMTGLMRELGLAIPSWQLRRFCTVRYNAADKEFVVRGHDEIDTPYNWVKKFEIIGETVRRQPKAANSAKSGEEGAEEAAAAVVEVVLGSGSLMPNAAFAPLSAQLTSSAAKPMAVRLHTFSHRGEPPCTIVLSEEAIASGESFVLSCDLSLDVAAKQWRGEVTPRA